MANKKHKVEEKKEPSIDYIVHISVRSCIYFTATTFLILFLYLLLNADLSAGVNPVALVAILPFSVLFACANTLYKYAKMDTWVRVLCHYALTVGGAFVCLYLPNKAADQTAAGSFVLFLAFTLIYLFIMGPVVYVGARVRRVNRDQSKYHSVYKK